MKRILTFTYNMLVSLALLFLLPKFLLKSKYRQSLKSRLGFGFPEISKRGKTFIWVHAVSVGEAKAVSNLIRRIKEECPDSVILVSNVTHTGFNEAKRSIPSVDHHVYLPFDLSCIIRPIIRKCRPDLCVISETDLWFNFLKAAKECGSKVVLVNGKLSGRSLKNYSRCKFFTKTLFSFIDLFCVQSEVYKTRFKSLGIDEEKIFVTGNLKFDLSPSSGMHEDKRKIIKDCGIQKDELVFVAGSTHDQEEEFVLSAFKEIWKEHAHVRLILVPRHPERFLKVEKIIESFQIPFALFADETITEKLVLVNQMGVLNKIYSVCDAAIVCGSFTDKIGGHNILEPLWFGKPVLFGPYMFSQPGLDELVLDAGAGMQVSNENLKNQIQLLILDKQRRFEMGISGKKLLEGIQGATNRTWEKISEFVPCVKA